MELISFDGCELSNRCYGGRHGGKLGITYQGHCYMLKFRSTHTSDGKTIIEDDPVCEHLGSEIYRLLGIPAQETLLGTWHGRLAVACRDFRQTENEFLELQNFQKGQATYLPSGMEPFLRSYEVDDILDVLDHQPLARRYPEAKARFWDMFIIDALLWNSCRFLEDWGFLVAFDGNVELAPVYGNGGCLNVGNEAAQQMRLDNLSDWALDARCPYHSKRGGNNPFSILAWSEDAVCQKEIRRIYRTCKKKEDALLELISRCDLLSPFQRTLLPISIVYRIDALRCICDCMNAEEELA